MARKRRVVMAPGEMDMTPMIDCVFLLLIFFMVTTVFKNPAQLQLTLPIVSNPQDLDKRQIIVELDSESNVALNSKIVSMDSFDAFLINEKKKTGVSTMLIKADENAKHGDVIKLMLIARSCQIEAIAMAVDTAKE